MSCRRRFSVPVWLLLALPIFAGCGDTTPYIHPRYRVAAMPAAADVDYRLFLIGDAGDVEDRNLHGLHALQAEIRRAPIRTAVVFLGDLIYERGYPADGSAEERARAKRRLQHELDAAVGAEAILVPGNHDWADGKEAGWRNVRELGRVVEEYAAASGERARLLPAGGCPGPVDVRLGRKVDLIALDTQWWLHQHAKPHVENNPTGCAPITEAEVMVRLRDLMVSARQAGRSVVIASHHPLRSRGPHGGFFDWTAHLFPMTMWSRWMWIPVPGLGSAVVYWRANHSWIHQDLSNPTYIHMKEAFEAALRDASMEGLTPLVFASGHEHNHQVMRDPRTKMVHVVSGVGTAYHAMGVSHDDTTLYSHSEADRAGFVELRFLNNDRVHLTVHEIEPGGEKTEAMYSEWLK
ncbi:MAG TPA: metallophosphoesterase [Terriglobales bacterium]|nr:metallophosphoesterase [Terriglobales bacterium]